MTKLDFGDFYHHIKPRTGTHHNKQKLRYSCIQPAYGTLAQSPAPMGPLGRNIVIDELTDLLFGDLDLQAKLCKLTDNIYCRDDHPTISSEETTIIKPLNLREKPTSTYLEVSSLASHLSVHNTQQTFPDIHPAIPLLVTGKKPP